MNNLLSKHHPTFLCISFVSLPAQHLHFLSSLLLLTALLYVCQPFSHLFPVLDQPGEICLVQQWLVQEHT